MLEDLRPGASVVSSDGHKLGTLHRFVVAMDTLKLTHVVVDTGILRSGEPLWKGGWGLSHDRVVPLGVLAQADAGEVRLTMSADEFRDLSVDYIEERFGQMPDLDPGRLDGSDIQRFAAALPGGLGAFVVTEVMAKPADAVDIKRDAPVWRMKPHEKIGEVDGLIYEEKGGKVDALVIRRGFVFTKDMLLPAGEIVEVVGEVVRVDLTDAQLERLEEFRAED